MKSRDKTDIAGKPKSSLTQAVPTGTTCSTLEAFIRDRARLRRDGFLPLSVSDYSTYCTGTLIRLFSVSHMNPSGRDRDSQRNSGAWTQSSVVNPAYPAWLNLPRLKEFSMSNDCGKTGKAVAGAETGGETGGWRRGCRGKTRAVRCPPTPLAPSASVRSIAGWVCGVCGVCGVYGVYGGSVPLSFCLGSPALIPLSPPCASLLP